MPEETKINTLVNLGQMKVVESIYNDVASPGFKKVGQALSTVLEVSNTIIWPIKWANERVRIFFENNLKKYQESLESVDFEQVMSVPSEISIPILERFRYISNEELSKAFVKLLTTASSTETVSSAHPGFISIIDRISPDEAKILAHFAQRPTLAALTFRWRNPDGTFRDVFIAKTQISKLVHLSFPENAGIYFDNLSSLGLIFLAEYYNLDMKADFEEIEKDNSDLIEKFKPKHVNDANKENAKQLTPNMFITTELGSLFLKACV